MRNLLILMGLLALFATPFCRAAQADDDIRAEIVTLPPLPEELKPAAVSPAPLKKIAAPAPSPTRNAADKLSAPVPTLDDPGYRVVLKGTLGKNTELKQSDSPVLIKGNLIIPVGCTLKVGAGTVIVMQPDESAPAPTDKSGAPDPRLGAVIWVWGTLAVEGVTGNPVEFSAKNGNEASILLYGAETCRFEGARFKNVAITQTGGIAQWQNCELVNARHYAMASGVATLTHCSLRSCGGIFVSYNVGAWSLLARRCVFENCREGIILGSDPGEARLIVEKNHFIGTRGAHLRVLPTAATRAVAGSKKADLDILIGENWYGTPVAEDVDLRIVDRRADPSLRARLNIRPPAEKPYADTGAGVNASVIAATLKEQEPVLKRLLAAHPWPRPKTPEAPPATQTASALKNSPAAPASSKTEKSDRSDGPAPMSKAVKKPAS